MLFKYTVSNKKLLKYKKPTTKYKLGSIYLPLKKNYLWCLHKNCILSTQCFSNKLELLKHCNEKH